MKRFHPAMARKIDEAVGAFELRIGELFAQSGRSAAFASANSADCKCHEQEVLMM
ncbi:MAG TPA: hypothetical protein VJZ71_03755 [Phycisphaerae bacterium]|nr:hypothetical protein [Phycisphaerae bacterium]